MFTTPTKKDVIRAAVIGIIGLGIVFRTYQSSHQYEGGWEKNRDKVRQEMREKNTLTSTSFLQVEMGDTLDEAIHQLGWGFDQISETQIGDVTTMVFKWEKPDPKDGIITLTLVDGRVVSKTQEGLK